MATPTSARVLGAAFVSLVIAGPAAYQQDPPPPPVPQSQSSPTSKPAARPLVPLRVQVNLVRYDGEKKTTSHPFTLWVNANGSPTTLNTGSRMPIPRVGTPGTSYEYSNVGTSIQCSAASMDDGRFRVDLTINDSSATPAKDAGGLPVLQSLNTSNNLLLRDGQSAQFVASTDKVTGEVTRIDVTVSILK